MNKYLKKAENSSGIDHYVRVPGTGAKQKITFTKMHGCANDYVYIDCFQMIFKTTPSSQSIFPTATPASAATASSTFVRPM